MSCFSSCKKQNNSPDSKNLEPNKTGLTLQTSKSVFNYGEDIDLIAKLSIIGQTNSRPPQGYVTFQIDQKDIGCNQIAVTDLVANCKVPKDFGGIGQYSVTAVYAGDETMYQSSDVSANYTVNQIKTQITLSVDPQKAIFPSTITFNATVENISTNDQKIIANGDVKFFRDAETQPFYQQKLANCQISQSDGKYICKYKKLIIGGSEQGVTFYSIYTSNDQFVEKSTSATQRVALASNVCNVPNMTIDYEKDCSVDGGCKFSFSCDNLSLSSKMLASRSQSSTFVIDTKNGGQIYSNGIPALLEKKSDSRIPIPPSWYIRKDDDQTQTKLTLQCTTVENSAGDGTIQCAQFGPVGRLFSITGATFNDGQNKPVTVNINQVDVQFNNEGKSTQKCGQFGTTYQRIFDCSTRVQKSAGFGNNGGSAFATLDLSGKCPANHNCNPDQNWFLVSCPDTNTSYCFWLSPVMTAENPSVGSNQYDSHHTPMANYTGTRLLWSGRSLATSKDMLLGRVHNFFQANGKGKTLKDGINESVYEYYPYKDDYTMASNQNDGIRNPVLTSPGTETTPRICKNTTPDQFGKCDYVAPSGNVNFSLWNQWSIYSESLCDSSRSKENIINLLTDSTYEWQMPSYPMLMTLTNCNKKSEYQPRLFKCNPHGFQADADFLDFASVPLWSSSVLSEYEVAEAFLWDGVVLPIKFSGDINLHDIRCASAKW